VRISIRTRLLLAFLAVAVLSAAGLAAFFASELESFAMRKLSERLYDESVLMSAMIAGHLRAEGTPALSARDAAAFAEELASTGFRISSHVRVLDASGEAVLDTSGTVEPGTGYASTPEVARALTGEYGASTRTAEDGRRLLSVAYPIMVDDQVTGVVYAQATTFTVRTLLRDYRARVVVVVALFVLGTLVLTELLSRWLAAPLKELAKGAVAFASGEHSVRVRPHGSREIRAVAVAFNAMADEVQSVLAELKEEEQRKTRFVSDVSHELRTPLTAIRGAAETLLDGDVPEEDARQFLSTMVRETERLGRLANDLLTLQRIEGATGELPITRVDLAEVARHSTEGLAPLTDGRGVAVVLEGHAPDVLGDKDRLQQVFGNLIDNASRMTPEGGTVTVLLSEEAGQAVVRVVDEGPGISDADAQRIFDRFYRAQPSRDRSTGGAGLGLAIVAAIVRAHGGTISAAAREGGIGSVFTLRLPALPDDTPPAG
jgi:two-component system OmpR family sensor kinase